MVADLGMKNKTFKIIFDNDIDVDYRLHDSELATKWFKKIKHLQNIPIDPVTSHQVDFSNLKDIFEQFCQYANLDTPMIDFESIRQKDLNALHKIYEDNHDRLSRLKDNSILYKFHQAIHKRENPTALKGKIPVCWGIKDGPLTQNMDKQPLYEKNIKKNNIYLPWAELGKTPYQYWTDKEPNDQDRFNALSKPHTTFRAKFFIATEDTNPRSFDPKFVEWFSRYKQGWLQHHNISKWENIHEDSAALLAITDYKGNLEGLKFKKIILGK